MRARASSRGAEAELAGEVLDLARDREVALHQLLVERALAPDRVCEAAVVRERLDVGAAAGDLQQLGDRAPVRLERLAGMLQHRLHPGPCWRPGDVPDGPLRPPARSVRPRG
jgi:hypothetical protein